MLYYIALCVLFVFVLLYTHGHIVELYPFIHNPLGPLYCYIVESELK